MSWYDGKGDEHDYDFYQIEYEVSDYDIDFDKHVDPYVEWVGIIGSGTVGDDGEADVESSDFDYDEECL